MRKKQKRFQSGNEIFATFAPKNRKKQVSEEVDQVVGKLLLSLPSLKKVKASAK